jgi:hypothetical protein
MYAKPRRQTWGQVLRKGAVFASVKTKGPFMSDSIDHARTQPAPDDKCPRCGGTMEKGKALFAVGANAMWEGKAPPVRLHDCLKCISCGHSEKFETEFIYGVE